MSQNLPVNALNRVLLTEQSKYSIADQSRARVTVVFSALFFVLHLTATFATVLLPATLQPAILVEGLSGLILNGIALLLVRGGRLSAAIALFTLYATLITITPLVAGGIDTGYLLLLALPLVYIGLMLGILGVFGMYLFLSAEIIITAYAQDHGQITSLVNGGFFTAVTVIAILSAISGVLAIFVGEQRRTALYASKLVSQLRATAEVAQTTSTILEPNELLDRTVTYIQDRFGFYHVQIFLLDADKRFANLEASTGDVGKALLKRGHRLGVGSQSIIGRVTLLGKSIIAADTSDDPVHRVNDLLPETRSELALPLIAGNQVIGALDVQSRRPKAFVQEDIDSLQIMASQISISIRNAQLFTEQKAALAENHRLLLDTETNLQEIEKLNRRLTGAAWEEYLRNRHAPTVGFTLHNNQIHPDTQWTPGLLQAANKGRPVIATEGNRHIVAVPVELRGQLIGAVEIETTDNVRQADMLDMMQLVAQRLALSVDNARLFEQAQEVAQQELEVNAISAKIQGITDMDQVLATVITELGRALGADQAAIRLGVRPDKPPTHTDAAIRPAQSNGTGNGTGNGNLAENRTMNGTMNGDGHS